MHLCLYTQQAYHWALNTITVKNKYPLPLISKLINKLQGAKYFTKPDVCWGFNNVHMKEEDEWKAAFWTNCGLYEPLVMFFGLTNSPATFQIVTNSFSSLTCAYHAFHFFLSFVIDMHFTQG